MRLVGHFSHAVQLQLSPWSAWGDRVAASRPVPWSAGCCLTCRGESSNSSATRPSCSNASCPVDGEHSGGARPRTRSRRGADAGPARAAAAAQERPGHAATWRGARGGAEGGSRAERQHRSYTTARAGAVASGGTRAGAASAGHGHRARYDSERHHHCTAGSAGRASTAGRHRGRGTTGDPRGPGYGHGSSYTCTCPPYTCTSPRGNAAGSRLQSCSCSRYRPPRLSRAARTCCCGTDRPRGTPTPDRTAMPAPSCGPSSSQCAKWAPGGRKGRVPGGRRDGGTCGPRRARRPAGAPARRR